MRYAQIDQSGICIGISNLSGEVDSPSLIQVGPSEEPLGTKWTGSDWVSPPLSSDQNILSAPLLGFGGPTAKELFNGNR